MTRKYDNSLFCTGLDFSPNNDSSDIFTKSKPNSVVSYFNNIGYLESNSNSKPTWCWSFVIYKWSTWYWICFSWSSCRSILFPITNASKEYIKYFLSIFCLSFLLMVAHLSSINSFSPTLPHAFLAKIKLCPSKSPRNTRLPVYSTSPHFDVVSFCKKK